jgi:dTDP-4-dehydrorhamnose 3,5-epimerase
MLFEEQFIPGLYVIEIEPRADERGFFARTWCADELAGAGLVGSVAQCSVSYNTRKGTLRGMHYQADPYAETKIVRCTAGAVYDVAVDLRPESPTFHKWFGIELQAGRHNMLYIPAGLAHGFQTLTDDAEVYYQISVPYQPDAGRGVRWDDPAFGIVWPLVNPILSERDATYPSVMADKGHQ